MQLRILCLILVAGCTAGSNPWADAYESDRAAMYKAIRDNHPGSVDALNPDFEFWLEDGLRAKRTVTDAHSYTYALLSYAAGFRDGHLSVSIDVERDVRNWPGFIVAWRNDELIVYASDIETVPVGAKVKSCDRLTASTFIDDRVFRFQMNPDIPGHWLRAGPRALIDLGNPFVSPPATCELDVDGERRSVDLEWRAFEWSEIGDSYREAAARVQPSASFFALTDDIAWFSAPTFGPNDEQRDIYNQAIARLATLDDPDSLIVIDLRGNGGGASMWGDRIVQAIWGESDSSLEIGYAEWRASDDNIAYWSTVPDYLTQQFGADHPSHEWAARILAGMQGARDASEPFWREPEFDDAMESDPGGPTREQAFGGTVAVLTDAQCASSCLDAMDVFHGRDNLVHIGGSTSADTQYMEVRTMDLPSGHARLTLPIKVYRNRERPDGGYFTPDIPYTGIDWSDEAIKNWVIALYEGGSLQR